METTIMGYIGTTVTTGNMLGLYWDNGKENGNYYIITGYLYGVIHRLGAFASFLRDVGIFSKLGSKFGTLKQ